MYCHCAETPIFIDIINYAVKHPVKSHQLPMCISKWCYLFYYIWLLTLMVICKLAFLVIKLVHAYTCVWLRGVALFSDDV